MLQDTNKIDEIRQTLIQAHKGHSYYNDAESKDWLSPHWGENSFFRPLFDRLDLTNVLDFACGHGRHTAQFISGAKSTTVADANSEAVAFCKERFKDNPKVKTFQTNGLGLKGLPSSEFTAIMAYDALIHFEATDVINHIFEFRRVLKTGGMALLHHSIDSDNPEGTFLASPGWRSFFSADMLRHFSARAGFELVKMETFDWPPRSGGKVVDGLSLLKAV